MTMRCSTLILVFALTLTEKPAQILRSTPADIRRGNYTMAISTPGAPTSKSFLSANGNYQVVIDDAEAPNSSDIKITVTMATVGHPNPTVLWRNDARGLPSGTLRPEDVLISDDGEFFLLAAMEERWLLFRKDFPPATLGNQRFTRHFYPYRSHFESLPNDLIAIDEIDKKAIVLVWHADWERWDAFDVNSNERIEISTNIVAKWNSLTREAILKKLSRLNQDKVRRQIGQYSPKLSEMATNVSPAVRLDEVREIDYQFLALQRTPSDRALFEEMVKPRSNEIPPPGWPNVPFPGFGRTFPLRPGGHDSRFSQQGQTLYVAFDSGRNNGDTLLAIFDQKATATNLTQSFLQRPQFYLGSAEGRIKLPLDVSGKTGPLRVWLAPRDKIKKDWMVVGAELMETDFKNQGGNYPPPGKEIHFLFMTVLPGEYLLKAIWDKRRGFDDRGMAGPGDYESDWVGPITITAGNTTSNIYAACTNRAATGGETYYAADELTLRLAAKVK
jgi:hypothetical protein